MSDSTTDEGRFTTLARRAETDPRSVSVDQLTSVLRTAPPDDAATASRAFLALERAEATTVSVVIDALGPLVDDDSVGKLAVEALADVVCEHPDRSEEAMPVLLDLVDRNDPYRRGRAFDALEALAAEQPDELIPDVLSSLRENLSADRLAEKGPALAVTARIGRTNPDDVAPLTPELVELTTLDRSHDRDAVHLTELPDHVQSRLQEDEGRWMRLRMVAALTLVEIAEANPSRFESHLGTLVDRLDEESNLTVREATYDVVWFVGRARPALGRPVIERLAPRLSAEEDPEICGKVARSLALLADSFPSAVVTAVESEVPVLVSMLDADEELAQTSAPNLLSYVAERRPERVEPATSRLSELALDGPPSVRGNAIWALSFVDDESAAATLGDIAETDPDPEIRTIAAEARKRTTADSSD